MVETALVAPEIEAGHALLHALDREDVEVPSALWLYIPDAGEWRLILALPLVDKEGPEAGYRVVQRALGKIAIPLPLRRISVVGVSEPLPQRLRRFVRTSATGTSDIRIGSTVVDGFRIEGAHVYRST